MAPTESRLGGRLRVRHRVHGHRPRGPDPQADRRPAARHAVAGVAAVHQLHGGHGLGHAHHRSGRQPDRCQADPAHRPRRHHRRRVPGRLVEHRHGDRRLAGPVGPRERPLRRDRPRDHRVVGAGFGGAGDHPLRGGARPRHRGRSARRRPARRDLLAWPVLRRLHPDGGRPGRHRGAAARRPPPAAKATSLLDPFRALRHRASSASRSPHCSTTSASSPCSRSPRSHSTWARTRSG